MAVSRSRPPAAFTDWQQVAAGWCDSNVARAGRRGGFKASNAVDTTDKNDCLSFVANNRVIRGTGDLSVQTEFCKKSTSISFHNATERRP